MVATCSLSLTVLSAVGLSWVDDTFSLVCVSRPKCADPDAEAEQPTASKALHVVALKLYFDFRKQD